MIASIRKTIKKRSNRFLLVFASQKHNRENLFSLVAFLFIFLYILWLVPKRTASRIAAPVKISVKHRRPKTAMQVTMT